MISGFVMIYAHGKDFGHHDAIPRFYWRRANRIIPTYWMLTIVYAAYLAYRHHGPTAGQTLASLFFFPTLIAGSDYGQPVLIQGWTLNYEVVFYLVFGAALFQRRGLWIVFGVFIAWVALGATGALGVNNPAAFWARPIVLFFLIGITIGLGMRRISTGLDFAATFLIIAAVLGVAIAGASYGGWKSRVAETLIGMAATVVVALCAWARETRGKSIVRSVAKMLGDATYSIYLTHFVVIGLFAGFAAKYLLGIGVFEFLAMCLLASSGVGIVAYRFVERPLMKAVGRMTGNRYSARALHDGLYKLMRQERGTR